jgi:hypothetical protein
MASFVIPTQLSTLKYNYINSLHKLDNIIIHIYLNININHKILHIMHKRNYNIIQVIVVPY